jgi:hypothetical protein
MLTADIVYTNNRFTEPTMIDLFIGTGPDQKVYRGLKSKVEALAICAQHGATLLSNA